MHPLEGTLKAPTCLSGLHICVGHNTPGTQGDMYGTRQVTCPIVDVKI